MKVTVITATAAPMDVIGIAAGMCYGKPTPSPKRVRRFAENGHMSVFEHATATLQIEGISRACLAQLTRHRIASYSVRSHRYCEVGGDDWCVIPPSVVGTDAESRFRAQASDAMWSYQAAIDEGAKFEDATTRAARRRRAWAPPALRGENRRTTGGRTAIANRLLRLC